MRARAWAAFVGFALLTASACSTFGSDDSAGTGDENGTTDAGSEATGALREAGVVDARLAMTDAGTRDPPCTSFDRVPGSIASWSSEASGAALTPKLVLGRAALDAVVTSDTQEARLVRDVSPDSLGRLSVNVDFVVVAGTTSVIGWLVKLVTLTCTPPAIEVSMSLAPGGELYVDSVASSAGFGMPSPVWSTLDLEINGNALTVSLGGVTKNMAVPASFAGAVGCTLAVGPKAVHSIPQTEASYAKACVQ